MNGADALDLMRACVWTMVLACGPFVLTALIVGVTISLIQALTSVQEATLSFAPKIVAILAVGAICAPFVGGQIGLLTQMIFSRVQSGF